MGAGLRGGEHHPARRRARRGGALCHDLHGAGVDGLILQDVGLLECDLPPLPLIASTQMQNHTPERVAFLEKVVSRARSRRASLTSTGSAPFAGQPPSSWKSSFLPSWVQSRAAVKLHQAVARTPRRRK